MTRIMPICMVCIHFDNDNTDKPEVCKAFPKGIPQKYWESKELHIKGDGIIFEPIDQEAKEYKDDVIKLLSD